MAVLEGVPGFSFGCDPEVFIVDGDGSPVPASGIIPGTKTEPHWIGDIAVQVDGMAAEFNIKPTTVFADFNRRIETALAALRGFLPDGHSLFIVPSVEFSKDVFDNAPDDAKELGCQPDFNAWTGSTNPRPSNVFNPYMFCAGGHFHTGWDGDCGLDIGDADHVMNCRELCQQFDWHLGAWSLRLDPDATRRTLYGKAGAFRPKPYGVEYRTLSNFWITTRERRLAVWNRAQNAIKDMRKSFLPELYPEDSKRVVESINESRRSSHLERRYRYPLTADRSEYPYNVEMAD